MSIGCNGIVLRVTSYFGRHTDAHDLSESTNVSDYASLLFGIKSPLQSLCVVVVSNISIGL